MKELSIEEKAKRFDEVKNKLSRFIAKGVDPLITMADVQDFFPELIESEDEKMWKLIKKYAHYNISDLALEADHITREHLESWLEKQKSVEEIVERCKNSWYNEGKIQGQIEGLTDEEKYQQGWHDALEKQDSYYTKRDVDDAYLKGIIDTKNEIEKQYKANYQIRKDIATFIFNYKGDIKDRAKWMDYLGIEVSFAEKQGEQHSDWSEEDEVMLDEIIDFFENGTVKLQHDLSLYASWLSSLKDRVGCEANCTTTWKPSDEQMEALDIAIRCGIQLGSLEEEALKSLKEQLKKI